MNQATVNATRSPQARPAMSSSANGARSEDRFAYAQLVQRCGIDESLRLRGRPQHHGVVLVPVSAVHGRTPRRARRPTS